MSDRSQHQSRSLQPTNCVGVDIDWLLVGAVFGQKRRLDWTHTSKIEILRSADSVDLLLVVEISEIVRLTKMGRRLSRAEGGLAHSSVTAAHSLESGRVCGRSMNFATTCAQREHAACRLAVVRLCHCAGGFAGAGTAARPGAIVACRRRRC